MNMWFSVSGWIYVLLLATGLFVSLTWTRREGRGLLIGSMALMLAGSLISNVASILIRVGSFSEGLQAVWFVSSMIGLAGHVMLVAFIVVARRERPAEEWDDLNEPPPD